MKRISIFLVGIIIVSLAYRIHIQFGKEQLKGKGINIEKRMFSNPDIRIK